MSMSALWRGETELTEGGGEEEAVGLGVSARHCLSLLLTSQPIHSCSAPKLCAPARTWPKRHEHLLHVLVHFKNPYACEIISAWKENRLFFCCVSSLENTRWCQIFIVCILLWRCGCGMLWVKENAMWICEQRCCWDTEGARIGEYHILTFCFLVAGAKTPGRKRSMMDTIMRLAVFLVTLKPSAWFGSSSVHTHTYAQMARERIQLITLTLTTVLHPESANNIFLFSLYVYLERKYYFISNSSRTKYMQCI